MEEDNNDMYENSSSSSYALHPQFSNSDEFSLFVHQILQRSSSSSSSSCPSATVGHTHTGATPTTQAAGAFQSTITAAAPAGGVDCFGGYSGCVSASAAAILSSSSVGGLSEYETDENDCQSKDGSEALTDEMQGKPGSNRGSSKRSRAAEVHNLSEKRRRSRINEKMKALQNLIPNSNKTDKASMLDEAIEYLKQLQLQVQMLYMRNGLSLHSMCLPGVLQPLDLSQMRMGFGEENQSLPFQTTGAPPLDNRRPDVHGLHNNASLDQPSMPTVQNMVPETLFIPESLSRNNLGPLQLHSSAEGLCREDVFCHQPNINQSGTPPLGFDRTMATGIFPSSTPAPDNNMTTSLEACFLGRSQSDGVLLNSIQHNDIPQHFSRAYPTISRNISSNGVKAEGWREL